MSSVWQQGKRDPIAGLSDTAADVATKARTSLDPDMVISTVEVLRDAKFKVDVALISAIATLHRTPSEAGNEPEAAAQASEPKSLKDKRVYVEVCKHDVDRKLISGKWVLQRFGRRQHGTCCVASKKT